MIRVPDGEIGEMGGKAREGHVGTLSTNKYLYSSAYIRPHLYTFFHFTRTFLHNVSLRTQVTPFDSRVATF